MVTVGDARSRVTRDQKAPTTSDRYEAHVKRTHSDEIKETWEKLKDTYGQK